MDHRWERDRRASGGIRARSRVHLRSGQEIPEAPCTRSGRGLIHGIYWQIQTIDGRAGDSRACQDLSRHSSPAFSGTRSNEAYEVQRSDQAEEGRWRLDAQGAYSGLYRPEGFAGAKR